MRKFVAYLFLLTITFVGASARGDTYPRRSGIDVLHYAFKLTLNDENAEIEGETTVDFVAKADGVALLPLDLASASPDGKGMTVTKVASAGKDATFRHESDRLEINLDPALKTGEKGTVVVSYKGTPRSGFLIGKNRYGDRTYFSENWPNKARQWLAVIDHPYDKSTSEFKVVAPSRYQVVSNGLLQSEIDLGDGRRQTHWKQSVPIAVWLNALGVAQFASHHAGNVRGIPMQTWVFRQDHERLFPALEDPARRAVELFIDKVGPYPYEKIAGVQAVGFDGGMELAGAIFYGQYSLQGRGTPSLVAHEMAHQWFGDSVTESDWDEVWLSEGFATFFAHVYAEKYEGREAYISGLVRDKRIIFGTEKRDPRTAVIHANLSNMERVLNPLVYQKGSWILHMLRSQIGEEAFWSGIRAYYARFRDKNATTADFRKVMEETSKSDLGWFFDQWLKRPGSPAVTGKWSHDPASKQLKIELAQTQPADPYRLPLEIAVALPGRPDPQVLRLELTQREQSFSFPIDAEPTSVTLDPGSKILMDAKFGK